MTTLDESYARCRRLTKSSSRSYYTAALLLPAVKRHHVHALYAFGRHAGQVVEAVGPVAAADQVRAVEEFGDQFFSDLDKGDSPDPVLRAVVHTVGAFDINPDCFRRFLRSLSTDLTVSEYETFDDLLDYLDGSAAAVGEMMLPILEPTSGEAVGYARDLAIAFQLTNVLRDVGAALDRGRVYLPQEDLARFGADPWQRHATPEWRELMTFEIHRTRDYYESGSPGVGVLPAASARCVNAALGMYSEVLAQVERADGDVFAPGTRGLPARQVFAAGRSLLRRGE